MILRNGRLFRVVSAAAILWSVASLAAQQPRGRDWPAVIHETKPWTRWWWHGSAVDRAGITAELEALKAAGIGGVEITPIYGVRGEETRSITFLSAEWVQMLAHTLREARRLGLGVDMATGTGWPFGGPWVGEGDAPRTLLHRTWTVDEGQRIPDRIRFRQPPLVRAIGNQIHVVNEGAPGDPPRSAAQPPPIRQDVRALQITDLQEPVSANANLQALALEQVKYPRDLLPIAVSAHGPDGAVVHLMPRVDSEGVLAWTAPRGTWQVWAVFAGAHGKLVERAAPGGEGHVIDHFSRDAIRKYLLPFDQALAGRALSGLRAFFNDSYEVDDASGQGNWTPQLFEEFDKRRGYDLRQHLPQLLGLSNDNDLNERVLTDYRATVSDLLRDTFTVEWDAWAARRGSAVRNQAHGAPANLLDLYALSDIPETEGTDVPRFKWATSAANVAGRRLVSAEAATWLGEHFRSTLADVKAAVDHFFVAGVNHIAYHGTAYSPDTDPWPGWQFYAAVEFNPQNAWWDDFDALNQYVTRVQSFLQAGRPAHDVLLYFPFHDAIASRGKQLLTHFGGANQTTAAAGFEAAAKTLQSRGYTYDYISDRQLGQMGIVNGDLTTAGGTYAALVVPPARYMPLDTLERIAALARGGAPVLVWKDWPSDVPGLADLDTRRRRFRQLRDSISEARRGDDLEALLGRAGVRREELVDHGLQFARRHVAGYGRVYFIANRGQRAFDGWVRLAGAPAQTVFNPMTGQRGQARYKREGTGSFFYLLLQPGESLILTSAPAAGAAPYAFYEPAGDPVAVVGSWAVRFVRGGPSLPSPRAIDRLASWTTFGGDDVKNFSGTTAYTTTFPKPAGPAAAWRLDLGRVHDSARVRLNGRDLGTLIGPQFTVIVRTADLAAANTLEIDVTNLSANRIADLDRRGVPWKKFYNVNMPARLPENRGPDGLFTAAKWTPLDSGLVGPVTLTPVR